MILSLLLVVAGFASLIVGAGWLVDGASSLARKFRVSELAIGLTIVAFGTSAPELVVSIIASAGHHSDIVLGNVIGSNNFNLFVILGIAGLIMPIAVQSSTAWKEIPISLGIALLLLVLLNFSPGWPVRVTSQAFLDRGEAILMLVLFLLFLYYVFVSMKSQSKELIVQGKDISGLKTALLIFFGLAGLVLGGQVVVTHSVIIARHWGVSEKIIGLTIVAAGTSLPELLTSVVAAFKKNSDIAIGNVIGSNIFNILLILPLSALISPLVFNPQFNADILVLIGGSAFLFIAMLSGQRKRLDRWEAGLLLVFYLLYAVFML